MSPLPNILVHLYLHLSIFGHFCTPFKHGWRRTKMDKHGETRAKPDKDWQSHSCLLQPFWVIQMFNLLKKRMSWRVLHHHVDSEQSHIAIKDNHIICLIRRRVDKEHIFFICVLVSKTIIVKCVNTLELKCLLDWNKHNSENLYTVFTAQFMKTNVAKRECTYSVWCYSAVAVIERHTRALTNVWHKHRNRGRQKSKKNQQMLSQIERLMEHIYTAGSFRTNH